MTWRLDGQERESGVPLSIVFAGQLENKNYFANLAFAQPPAETALGRRWLWTLLPRANGRLRDPGDVRIVQLEPDQRQRFTGRFQFLVPCWVGGEINLQVAVAHIRQSKNAKEDLRRIRRDQITYEVATIEEAFEHFHATMYLPYITGIFGDRAFPMTREEMASKRDCRELFLIKMRGEAVAGLIILYEGSGPRAWSLGVKDGDRAYVKAGALRALDYLLLFYLADKGHKTVNMGASRPFLKDGVLRHKRRIGMRLNYHPARGFALMPTPGSPAAKAFVASNPFIFEHNGEYVGAALPLSASSAISPEETRRLLDEYAMPGLAGLALLPVMDESPITYVRAETGGHGPSTRQAIEYARMKPPTPLSCADA
jgi:hypothetical protein